VLGNKKLSDELPEEKLIARCHEDLTKNLGPLWPVVPVYGRQKRPLVRKAEGRLQRPLIISRLERSVADN
jgi:hypothetical protein